MAFARPRPEVVHSSFSGLWESQLETALSVGIWRDHPGAAPTGDCTHCSAPLSHRGSEVHQGAQQGRPREIGAVLAGNPHEPQPLELDHRDQKLRSLCEALMGQDSEIGAIELRKVLNGAFSRRTDVKFHGFSIHTCREMVSLVDSAGTGTLGPAELQTLWLKIWKYLEIYQETNHNHLGTLGAHEMRTALRKEGFTLNNEVQQTIASRYSSHTLGLDFDSFVACVVRLETLFKLFGLLDWNQTGVIQLSLAEWLCCVLV